MIKVILFVFLILLIFIIIYDTTNNDKIDNFTINKNRYINQNTNEVRYIVQKNKLNVNRINTDEVNSMRDELNKMYNSIEDIDNNIKNRFSYDYRNDKTVINGWFVIVYELGQTPMTSRHLGVVIDKVHGIKRLCFRSQIGDVPFPFLNSPDKPYFLPKSEKVGLRALTLYKVPKNASYKFRLISDDGSLLSMARVKSNVLKDLKINGMWNLLISNWDFQAETTKTSEEVKLVESEFILLRVDYFQNRGQSALCLKVSIDDSEFKDIDHNSTYNSLNWNNIPLLNVR